MTDLEPAAAPAVRPKPKLSRRPPLKAGMHLLRRGHLYFGLLLFPWAILYGVTAFLFNHPTVFSDSGATTFGAETFHGTPMESPGSTTEVAHQIVAVLNERAKDSSLYTLSPNIAPAYNREFSFATVKTDDGRTINVGLDATGNGGTIRGQAPRPEAKPVERAPFAIGTGPANREGRGGRPQQTPRRNPTENGLALVQPLHERVKATIPVVLERTGFPTGEITVTSVPDLTFQISDRDGTQWNVTANALAGTVNGTRADAEKVPSELSVRRFLLRLHTAHGYPSSGGIRWWWAVIVDAMAFVMVFWGLSGLLMWWQMKAQRKIGVVMVVLSIAGAVYLAMGMHSMMTG
jgi:hypothetical protein